MYPALCGGSDQINKSRGGGGRATLVALITPTTQRWMYYPVLCGGSGQINKRRGRLLVIKSKCGSETHAFLLLEAILSGSIVRFMVDSLSPSRWSVNRW